MGNKTFDFSSKKKDFLPKNVPIWPEIGILAIVGSFGALLVGWLVVVARELYLARHLFTLYIEQSGDLLKCHHSLTTLKDRASYSVHEK